MKILIFNWRDIKHDWAGGSEIYIFEIARRWVEKGHTVTLFCGQNQDEKLKFFEKIDGINVYRKGGRFSVYLWAIYYYLFKLKNDADIVVDTENGIPFFTPIYIRKPKVCIVFHVHKKQFFYEFSFPYNLIGVFIERIIFPLIYLNTKIIAISKTTKKDLEDIGFNGKKIEIVYSGVDKNIGITKGNLGKFSKPTLIYLGRIKKYKRINLLIKIMPKILEKVANTRLIIAGWGTEAPFVVDGIMKGNVNRHIDILGRVSEKEKKKLLSRSWIFINPSIGEGWSIAVIEANLHGTPAISFDVTGLSESIQNGKTGFLVKSEKELINKICLVLNNYNKRISLSSNAKKWAETFSWDTAADRSLKILETIKK